MQQKLQQDEATASTLEAVQRFNEVFNPSISTGGSQDRLTWNDPGTIAPGGVETLSFQATASVGAGEYFNEVTVEIAGLVYDPYTWLTAKVTVFDRLKVNATDGRTTTSSDVWFNTSETIKDKWTVSTN